MKEPVPSTIGDQRPKHKIPPVCIQRDISNTTTFQDIKRRHEAFLQPGENQAVDFSQVQFSPDGKSVVGVATVCHELKGEPTTQLAVVDAESGALKLLGKERASDKGPRWAPDGKTISFISRVGEMNQLRLLDTDSGAVRAAPEVEGNVEQQSWSEDGNAILLIVAGLGADKSGAEGSSTLNADATSSEESWLPAIETADAADAYRTCWIYTLASGSMKPATPATLNIWEAVWATNEYIVALCSDLPGEDYWYTATVREICIETKATKTLYESPVQIECLRASPDGSKIAFTVGLASDRLVVRGDLRYVERETGKVVEADTKNLDVGWIEWSDDDSLVVAGSRDSVETIARYNFKTGEIQDAWTGQDLSIGPRWSSEFACHGKNGVRLAFVQMGWFNPPTLMRVSGTEVRKVLSFSSPQLHQEISKLGSCHNMRWKAPDGLEVQGYYLAPTEKSPCPVVLLVHGGPVAEWRPRYIGLPGNFTLMQAFLAEGWGVFLPNVRGSSGRGQAFIERVYGDMGGLDTYDYLSGLDALVESGQADAKRLAVIGGSYGGFMSSWLITQTNRFAAAAPIAPVTNWVSEHYTCNIGFFCRDFLRDDSNNFTGKYFSRSPLHHVQNVTTPALMICGARDKCTPPGQALEFYRALVEQGKCSVLLTYPEEGHGVRRMPAYFDMAARTIEWFRNFLV